MAKYLVTGGGGFIGSHLVEALILQGHSVRVVDNFVHGQITELMGRCELRVEDICDFGVMRSAMENVDGCFHLAAVAPERTLEVTKSAEETLVNDHWAVAHQVNLLGSIRVLEAAKKAKTPVVYASSAAVYGDNADLPLSERSTARPLTAYGADKLATELHARVASLLHGVPTTGLRLFNVFGPRQNPQSSYSNVISIFIKQVLAQKPLEVHGDGEQVRDFIYVDDAVRFLCAAMANASTNADIFNVCRGEALSVNQLASIIMSLADQRVAVYHQAPRRGDIRTSIGSPMRAGCELGCFATTSVIQGLRNLIAHQRDFAEPNVLRAQST
ncbi:NAD-dependent epimerase/dehydratase family protein [Vibrio sp. SM6]|uniref:NAD-dependent epimerase/dehydratase family protein n=1 Tax=Vibrio agarilyticus TaxID=2726741 RepID=A0A7X8TQT8_9VIBR|nr:NAD-dependent epimerase/dehydratase family protein [Vibrio agarilyticus]NLS12917.1 NAD-dependent epimerase/dehydratase family protein [Vibrio agarilyticus]